MIIGRVIAGFGIGVNTTTIPMWQAETSRPHLRGRLVAFELTCLVGGFVVTNWINFGFTYLPESEVSWRFPLGFQSLLAVGTAAIVPFLVESPRWLCLKGREEEARIAIARLYAKPVDDDEVYESLELMKDAIAREKEEGQIGWREALHNGRQQTLRRILLGAGANFMQQMGGVNVS
jgi:MFS family permease